MQNSQLLLVNGLGTHCLTGYTEGVNTVMEQKAEMESNSEPSVNTYYDYEELRSRPSITPESVIPENLLHQCHSFGYDSGRRGNLQLLDDRTLMFIAGNLVIVLDVSTKTQRYLRSCSGGGIGSIAVHPTKKHFAVAEKGNQPNIIVYEYPSLRPYRILRGGTERAYSSVAFNSDGSLLASVGNAPDFWLTLWDWRQEQVTLRSKAMSQEVYRVSFSQFKPERLTTSGFGHIKFWEMADTFTGLKLQGQIGHFGSTPPTDIEGYVELPDGKVVSGSNWGNLLLWEGSTVKMEISRKEGQSCHKGTIQPLALEDGQLVTFGSDGVVRGWDFERIDAENSDGKFELEPLNEMVVGHNVSLQSLVRSPQPDSSLWFAQDSSGAIWKLDLSFTHTAADAERLFSFHAGPIQGLDVSMTSHLMTTTAADRSVKVYDFLSNREVTSSRFNQGGTVIRWAPLSVDQSEGLLVAGFEDGAVRILELFNPQKLTGSSGYNHKGEAKLRLKQAFKPHNASVTAVAYKPDGEILATGGSDSTVFFFTVGEKYNPIGFMHVPGPVQALEWSPYAESGNKLLILCQRGHVIEVQSPDPEAQGSTKSYQLHGLPSRSFRFRSIKSQIKREEEIARRQALEEKKAEGDKEEEEGDEEDEEEEELPSIHIPDPPSPVCFGLYSQPDQFWLSMGGFDSGFLYHCKFSENQDEDPNQRQDEPFDFLPVHNADDDAILSIAFSSDRKLLFCGMHSGSIRVYPLQPDDHSLTSMQAYWTLSIHDNQYGHLRHVCCSHDDQFVLTAGDDGNIFSFSLIPPEELMQNQKRRKARVPSPRVGLGDESLAQDIEDPTVYSIETAKQRLEADNLHREAQVKIAAKRKKLAELQKNFLQLLRHNQSLPEHVRLQPSELQLDQRFNDQAVELKTQQVTDIRKRMNWEEERCNIGLGKLQDWDSLGANVVSVIGIGNDHRVSTYRLPVLATSSTQHQSDPSRTDGDTAGATRRKKNRPQSIVSSDTEDEEMLRPSAARPPAKQPTQQKKDRILTAEEKADQARALIEERKKKWDKLYAEKPGGDNEDPQDVQAIREAKENIGDLKLKSDKDFMVPKHLRMNSEKTRAKLKSLQEKIREKQTEMNRRIIALRDSKVHLVSQLHDQTKQLQKIQQSLLPDLHRPPPTLPSMLPEEMPEKKLQFNNETLDRYRDLREQRFLAMEQEGTTSILELLEKEMEGKEERREEGSPSLSASPLTREEEMEQGEGLSELEEETRRREEIRLRYEQDSLLEEMESSMCQFDTKLRLLRHEKLGLDWELKQADLHLLTLYQELLIHEEFQMKEASLQEKLDERVEEESSVTCLVEECTEKLEMMQAEVNKLQDKEKALAAAFQAWLGEENRFEKFLNRVFKMKIKPVKKEETGNEREEYSDEDSDDSNDYDCDYGSESDEEGAALDYSVCPPGCDPDSFENTLKMRECRLDLEELLADKKKRADALRKEYDFLVKKEQLLKNSRKAAEDDMDLIHREKQRKMNELDVVVPLRLNQIEFVTNGSVPSDMTPALVLDRMELRRLEERIKQLHIEKNQQRDLYSQARQQYVKLIQDRKDRNARIEESEKQCNQLMMMKYGRIVDLDALLTMTGSKMLEELKLKKFLKETEYFKEINQWDVKLEKAHEALMELTRCNTERLFKMTSLLDQKKDLEHQLNMRQRMMVREFRNNRRHVYQEDIQRLQALVNSQQQQAQALRTEISLLSRKGVHVPPPGPARLPPLTPLPCCSSRGCHTKLTQQTGM